MVKVILIILFAFSSLQSVLAEDMFCYRDTGGNLKCKKDISQIPLKFQSSAFFKPSVKVPNKNDVTTSKTADNVPDPVNKNQGLPPAQTSRATEEEIEESTTSIETPIKEKENAELEIFIAQWCPHCKALEKFLKERHVKYKKYDVETDDYGAEVYLREGTIPITILRGKTILGFDQRRFSEILDAELPY